MKLCVLAGPSLDKLEPITDIINTRKARYIKSDHFEGYLVVHAKDLPGTPDDDPYFELEQRKGITWSIQVKGRFMDVYSADDILFGNVFDHALKLPYGSGAVFKFMSYIDPTLENDLGSSTRPYALSPLVATMPHFAHSRIPPPPNIDDIDDVDDLPELQPEIPELDPFTALVDDLSQLHLALAPKDEEEDDDDPSSSSESLPLDSNASLKEDESALSRTSAKKWENDVTQLTTASQRQSYFAKPENRRQFAFGPEDLLSVDFCYGYLSFNPQPALALPGGISFDLLKHWDGQPVRFVCCERRLPDSTSPHPYNKIFWCVSIEPSNDD